MLIRLYFTLVLIASFGIAGCGGGSGDEGASDDGRGADGNDSDRGRVTAAVTGFDPNDRDRAALWWAKQVKKVVDAKATENAIVIEEAMQDLATAVQPLAGQRIRFKFGVFQANPDLPETVWKYEPISTQGVWVGLLHRADPGRIRVGVPVQNRQGPRAFLLKAGEHLDPAILRELRMTSTFEISATISHTAFERFDTWHNGFKRFTDTPTLAIYIRDIKVEKVNP